MPTRTRSAPMKNDDTKEMVAELQWIGVTPHVSQNTSRLGGYAVEGRTTPINVTPRRSTPAAASRRLLAGSIKKWG